LALFATLENTTLGEFLDKLFESAEKETTVASDAEKAKFARFMKSYKAGLAVEKRATETFN
jgi:hypothetical protein